MCGVIDGTYVVSGMAVLAALMLDYLIVQLEGFWYDYARDVVVTGPPGMRKKCLVLVSVVVDLWSCAFCHNVPFASLFLH